YRRALDLRQGLADEFAAVPHRVDLADSQYHFGYLHALWHRPADALLWYDRALALLQPLHEHDPRDAGVRKLLGKPHGVRAQALDELKRHGEALAEWDAALRLMPPADRPWVQMERARGRARAGQAAEAVADAAALTKDPATPGRTLYSAACVCSL